MELSNRKLLIYSLWVLLTLKIDEMRGTWEIDAFCNLEADALLELVTGIKELDGDLTG